MRYLQRVHTRNQAKIWDLFKDLPKISGEVHSLEIIRSARSGAIRLDQEFSLKDYAHTIRERERISQIRSQKEVISLLPNYEDNDVVKSNSFGLTEEQIQEENSRITGKKNHFDIEDLSPSYRRKISLSEVDSATRKYMHTGYNFKVALINSLKKNSTAIKTLNEMLDSYPELRTVALNYIRENVSDTSY